jgi:hypothetical protein
MSYVNLINCEGTSMTLNSNERFIIFTVVLKRDVCLLEAAVKIL